MLFVCFSVLVRQQPTCSTLEFGWLFKAWLKTPSVQAAKVKALCNTVDRAWEDMDATKLRNVFERWKLVLDLIIKDDGGDRYIEANRGKLFKAPSPEAEELDEEENKEEEELSAEEIDCNDLD